MPVVAYLCLVSLNAQWNLRRLPDGCSIEKSQFWGKKILSLEDAAAQCHDFSDFIASSFSERYRNGHNNKCIL